MRIIFTVLIILFLPTLSSAQKKSAKAITNYPITVMTESGTKTIQDPKTNWETRIKNAIAPSARTMDAGPGTAIWTGEVSDDWFDPGNWEGGEVPGEETHVMITAGDNDPFIAAGQGAIIIQGLQMDNYRSLHAEVLVEVSSLFVVDHAYLNFEAGLNIIGSTLTEIANSYFEGPQSFYSSITINIADGGALIYGNEFHGNYFYIQDSPDREGTIYMFNNEFAKNTNVTITNKATGQGEDYNMYIANGENSDVFYSLNLTNESRYSRVMIGTGTNPTENEQLIINGHLDIDRTYSTMRYGIYIDKITFAGDEFTLFNAKEFPGIDYGGPVSPADPIIIDKLFFEKDSRYLLINDNITVTELLRLIDRESYLQMGDTKALTMLNGSEVVDENPENGSFVMGRMVKEGNEAFTFPIGAYFSIPIGSRPIAPNSSHRTMALEGRFKAPLSISAPSDPFDKFRAEYIREHPDYNGYDITSHSSEVNNIFYDGYWRLERLGYTNSDVVVTLTYDKDHYEIMELDKDNLKIAGWQGGEWVNIGALPAEGTEDRGTITTNTGLDMYGPLALHSGITTRVPIITIDSPTDTYEFCKGNRNFTMHISMDTLAMDGSIFDVQISDMNGSFENSGGIPLGTAYYEDGKLEYQIAVTLRNYSDYKDNNYKLRVVSHPQGAISTNTISLVENTIPEQVTITGPDIICMEDGSFKFYPEEYQEGVSYDWTFSRLDHTIEMVGDTAVVTFLESGTTTIRVVPSNGCGTGISTTEELRVRLGSTDVFADPVANMMPEDGSIDQKLPLVLSWVPGENSVYHDIHIWEEGTSKPEDPIVSEITSINHSIPESAGLEYGKTYNWQVNSSLGCLVTEGPVQSLKLRDVPDLEVIEINAPGSATSGQNITIDYKIKNVGLAETMTNETWNDGVFLSPMENHTATNFNHAATNPEGWNPVGGTPLLVGAVENVTSLEPGDEYTGSASINVPLRFDLPLYVYVITNYKGGKHAPAQTNYANDTMRTINPITIIPVPTPDLRVEEVFPPASAFSGSTISVTYEVQNHGVLTPAGSSWKDRIYISKDQVFNKENAILLTRPTHNDMYYPADSATFVRDTQMEDDASVIYSEEVVIPNFISGTWFIHVVTNEEELLYEGSATGNNANNKQIQINLTPTPQFVINSLNIPVTDISNTQAFGIDWNVNNTGAYDNIKRNRGIYFRKTDEECGGPSKEAPKGYREVDSLSWGGSFWTDRVYLSDDPNSFNPNRAILLGEVEKGIKNSRVRENEMKSLPKVVQHCSAGIVTSPFHRLSSVSETTNNVIRPGANYAGNLNVNIPKDLPEGDYYIYVLTNSDNTVFTYIDTPVVRRSHKLTLSHPDLSVADVSVPGEITGGTTFHLDYTVSNIGQGSLYGTTSRKDYIYYSSSPVFDEQAELLKAFDYQDQIPFGESREYSAEVQLPPSHSGTTYFFVKTNGNEAIAESNLDNNLSTQTVVANVSQYPPADLVVSDIVVSDTTMVPDKFYIHYTTENIGLHKASGTTTDSIYMSCSPIFSSGNAIAIGGRKDRSRNIEPGNSVVDSIEVNINKVAYLMDECFAKADYSDVYFHVVVNISESIYEEGHTTNNTTTTDKKVLENKNIDLEVLHISGEDNGLVGRPYPMKFTVKNIGLANSRSTVAKVFFSKNQDFNEGVFEAAGLGISIRNSIKPQDSLNLNLSNEVVIPKMPEGDYYVFVVLDSRGTFDTEVHLDNNTGILTDELGNPLQVSIESPILSDLEGEIFDTPEMVAVGQPLKIKYRVTNTGDGVTYPNKWTDGVWLSQGVKPGAKEGGTFVETRTHAGNLEANEFYEDSARAFIPIDMNAGNYMIIVDVDDKNKVIEDNDDNNLALQSVTIYVPDPSDLIVDDISAPDTMYLGAIADSIKWTIKNRSSNTAEGVSTDGVYLSKNPEFDSSATLIGVIKKDMKLLAIGVDTVVMKPMINNVPEGDYYLIVRTDIQNNILETDKSNNESTLTQQVFVSVKELVLNGTIDDQVREPSFYKLNIPDTLIGGTVLVTLKSADSLSVNNEMYVGAGYIPSIAQYDYKYDRSNYGNQQILINDITDSVYYVSIRSMPPISKMQDITISAEVLPFSILKVESDRGGNGGNVTVKITGSLLTPDMTARLENANGTIHGTNVHFVNSTLAYVTFPLFGEAIGIYDLILTKDEDSEAILTGGFSVVSPDNGGLYSGGGVNTGQIGEGTEPGCDPGALAGLNSQMTTELIVAKHLAYNRVFPIQIRYTNPTNMDIPVQTKILINDYGVKMGYDRDEVNQQKGSDILYIELKETDGPPGVIRAGSSGTITVYGRKDPWSILGGVVNFELK